MSKFIKARSSSLLFDITKVLTIKSSDYQSLFSVYYITHDCMFLLIVAVQSSRQQKIREWTWDASSHCVSSPVYSVSRRSSWAHPLPLSTNDPPLELCRLPSIREAPYYLLSSGSVQSHATRNPSSGVTTFSVRANCQQYSLVPSYWRWLRRRSTWLHLQ